MTVCLDGAVPFGMPADPRFGIAGGRGEIGRRARFRIWFRKEWGFESLRPHQALTLPQGLKNADAL